MTPIVLITGFLGAGKTTFLSRLATTLLELGLEPKIILNDFEKAEIDAESIASQGIEVEAISGSCVCCDSAEELFYCLDQFDIDERTVVLVETNGTTDPGPLVDTLLVSKLGLKYNALLQIHLVDLMRWGRRGVDNRLELLQTRTASHLVFTWGDRVERGRELKVRKEVATLNAGAVEVSIADLGKHLLEMTGVPGDDLPPQFVRYEGEDRQVSKPSWSLKTRMPSGDSGSNHRFDIPTLSSSAVKGSEHHLSHRHRAVQIPLPERVHPLEVVAWLHSLPVAVSRAKGIVAFSDPFDEQYFFQKVGDDISFSRRSGLPRKNRGLALLVGVGIDTHALQANTFVQGTHPFPTSDSIN